MVYLAVKGIKSSHYVKCCNVEQLLESVKPFGFVIAAIPADVISLVCYSEFLRIATVVFHKLDAVLVSE